MSYPIWWIKTIQYLRNVSGTVYEDHLDGLVRSLMHQYGVTVDPDYENIVDFLNRIYTNDPNRYPLKTHPITGEIYTIPYMRPELDRLIFETDDDYCFNSFLYEDSFNMPDESTIILIHSAEEGFNKDCFSYDYDKNEINIDFSKCKGCCKGKTVAYINFSLESILNYATNRVNQININIGTINAQNVIFLGETSLSFFQTVHKLPIITGGISFAGSTFEKSLHLDNLLFRFNDYYTHANNLDFRNARFFEDVIIRNVKFYNTSTDNKITFEDARITGNFEIANADFEHANLYCFQMVFGNYNKLYNKDLLCYKHTIELNNIMSAEDSRIDFVDVELSCGTVRIRNISHIPTTYFCFGPTYGVSGEEKICPDIKMHVMGSTINHSLVLSNVSELSFEKVRNLGNIIADEKWQNVDVKKWRETHSGKYHIKSAGIGPTTINNKVLLAVYNSDYSSKHTISNGENIFKYHKAKSFIMLKENFASQGLYDDEDAAFILYMEFKPFVDSYNSGTSLDRIKCKKSTCILYKALYATGKYGISPTRVIKGIFFVILTFSLLYFLVSLSSINESYSLGNVVLSSDGFLSKFVNNLVSGTSSEFGIVLKQLLGAFLYSLESIIPFIAQFEPIKLSVLFVSAIENFIGTFLIGYFSLAVVRKTLR